MLQYRGMKKQNFVIIDGNAIIHRAYHALPPLTARDGTVVNAVYGFTSMLLKVLNHLKPDYLAVSFDLPGGTFRDEIYEDYKATRVKADQELYDQIPLAHEVVEAFDIPIYTKEGYEADDVIGTITHKTKKLKVKGITSIIVSGDKDLLQLVDDQKVEVYLLRKGISEYELYDDKAVEERFGFGPEYIVDFKSLMGDSSDNIPGVAGVGKKTATDLIQKVGGLDKIYKNLDKLEDFGIKGSVKKKLEADEDNARMSKELAQIHTDVKDIKFSIKDCVVSELNIEEIKELFKKFEFYSLINRLPGVKASERKASKSSKKEKTRNIELDELVSSLKKAESFYCKEVLDGKDLFSDKLRGLVFVTGGESSFLELNWLPGKTEIQKKDLKSFNQIFSDQEKTLVGHDLKKLIKSLDVFGLGVENQLFDVMVASYIIDSSSRNHDLASVVLRETGKELHKSNEQGTLFGVDPSVVATHGSYILEVQEKQVEKLKKDANLGLFEKIEMPLIPVLAEMEFNGIAVDSKLLNGLSERATSTINKLNKKIWKEAGEEFNVASSVQLREILFEKMELPTEGIKKGKTGYSTASSELEKLRGFSPVIEMIEEFREVSKLQNTYTDVLPGLVNKNTRRIHTTFNQAVTTTGRLSSSDPNLQNIPIRTELGREIRNAFVSEKGNTLIAADYSQIELRIVASLAQDKTLLEIFKKGEDVHKATAAAINGVPLKDVTKEMRSAAKEVNFGVLYGMGAFGLSMRTGIPAWQAKEFIEKYFEKFSGVKKYLDQTLKFAKKEGYVETLFGRRRYIVELKSQNYQIRSAGERMAINMPIQGTAADLMKMAMIKVFQKIKEIKNYRQKIRMILQVHDELVLEVGKGMEKEISELVKEEMENVTELRVPIEVHVGAGKSWGGIK